MARMHVYSSRPKAIAQRGVSLLEVMVALLILGVGLLGMTRLQVATAKYRVNVQAQAEVSQLVSHVAEAMRINADAAGPEYDPSVAGVPSRYQLLDTWAEQQAATLSMTKDCSAQTCTADERANFDMVRWRRLLRERLPQGAALIEGDKRTGIDVAVMWMDKEQIQQEVDAVSHESVTSLVAAPVCQPDPTAALVHHCCPAAAQVPVGVRCMRMSFIP